MSQSPAKLELVGVVHPLVQHEWKRAALVFDHLAIESRFLAHMDALRADLQNLKVRLIRFCGQVGEVKSIC